ncbi:isoprenylcysteine carboxylmethyltransferase family protein [Solitalea sp. MAHUQ-68]|uniref:Isoprenylcysteine carboxylmethyltransferase family protein n=1 Tax=Solitalea agri TaxID=2953739 RepID=A0A9X2JGD3_9SPHI|nr:isoprenylcysteine carboxylmethyltransferase family protein [Solitalea agri]MCO4294326.1 isoprenylcysteine carboxylmethyltransferase family protein [Solitalea agri]
MSHSPSLLAHLRDVLILPFTMTVIVPWLIYNPSKLFLIDNVFIDLAGGIILVVGLSIFAYTVFLFKLLGKGTLAPWQPTQKLIVAGPYRYCRNPMITGVFFILIGEAFLFHSLSIIYWSGLFFVINTVYFVLKEEPDLYKRFGDEYARYKLHVPRWIPRLKPYTHQL